MARRRNATTNMETMVTPTSQVRHTLSPLTFGSYLPCQFRSIQEEEEHEDKCNSVRLNYGKKPGYGEGLALAYEPPRQRDGKITVKFTTEDIKETNSYWSTTLTSYVLGDTPYDKSMEKKQINMHPKPFILYVTVMEDRYFKGLVQQTENGINLTEPKKVEREFVAFFTSIIGDRTKELPCPNSMVIKKGPCLNRDQCVYSNQIWKRMLKWIENYRSIGPWQQEIEWVSRIAKKKMLKLKLYGVPLQWLSTISGNIGRL
ncbi:hypothetical protein RDI58_007442 [Solanum bulbocastanum]|uniref:Uncharacterized protein n=1 Tax=Solanum bulbocastanum TaxID=147425 RepID=A0AAN8YHP9_SOLBU